MTLIEKIDCPKGAAKNFKRYLFEYRHGNSDWGLEIIATSPEDAKQRLKALAWASYQGEISAKVSVPGGGLLRKIIRALQALINRERVLR
jgi:hypothetical protein